MKREQFNRALWIAGSHMNVQAAGADRVLSEDELLEACNNAQDEVRGIFPLVDGAIYVRPWSNPDTDFAGFEISYVPAGQAAELHKERAEYKFADHGIDVA